ncbi:hypothetical protein CJD36_009285 [Flavipsychrobacter stenotrophus]|uniref:Uncharacterized protein n=2 Tax=Flavipsychrobacter stenotrophus TaxID=2077091 RepID=A0A2S7SZ28_9BACT|nr:hypothetical protein CJD36_009285 [Flavipsychrobacter stenotrophus]
MILGEESITALMHHIYGYQAAPGSKEVNDELNPNFNGFHDFAAAYYGRSSSSRGCKNIILSAHFGQEKEAFVAFFELLDLFKNGYQLSVSKEVLFKLIETLMLDKNEALQLNEEDNNALYVTLKMLPVSLKDPDSMADYDWILNRLKELGADNVAFTNLIAGLEEKAAVRRL